MPFKSEKQRRYLWATHPELAKEWAHKYPESNKNLPMYARPKAKSEKTATHPVSLAYVNKGDASIMSTYNHMQDNISKTAEDATYRVKLPQSDKPTYAGQEQEEGAKPDENTKTDNVEQREPENAINSLLQKIAIVLSRPMAQRLENRRAERERRKPQYQPQNRGFRQYAVPSPYTPLPMGMQPQQPQQQAPQAQQTAASTQVSQPGNSPTMNPINSFGALSSTGNINGNAAFGQKNSPDSAKMAAVIYKWASGNNEALTAPMNMDADIFPEPDDQDYENEGLSKTAALRNLYEKWAGVANTRRGPQNSLNAAALNI